MNYPKVLVGGPVSKNHEYAMDRFLESINNLDYKNYDILLIDNSDSDEFYNKYKDKVNIIRDGSQFQSIKKRMVYCRNVMRKKVLEEGYDYFFDVDQDVLVPKEALKRLIEHRKDVVSGVYYSYFTHNNKERKLPVAYGWFTKEQEEEILKNKEKLKQANQKFYQTLEKENWNFIRIRRQLTEKEVEGEKLIEIKMCGTGCILISRNVLEKIEFRENIEGGLMTQFFARIY